LQQEKQATTKASNNKSKQQQKQATTKASNNKSKQQQSNQQQKQPTTKATTDFAETATESHGCIFRVVPWLFP